MRRALSPFHEERLELSLHFWWLIKYDRIALKIFKIKMLHIPTKSAICGIKPTLFGLLFF